MKSGIVEHMTYVPKAWGSETWITNTDKYCAKILRIAKGMFCSFHYHKIKEETFTVISGQVLIICADQAEATTIAIGDVSRDTPMIQKILYPGQAWNILPGCVHQFYAIDDAVIFETSTHHLDSDSYRLTAVFKGSV
jgi:D-lyxose ketol-isomerase